MAWWELDFNDNQKDTAQVMAIAPVTQRAPLIQIRSLESPIYQVLAVTSGVYDDLIGLICEFAGFDSFKYSVIR